MIRKPIKFFFVFTKLDCNNQTILYKKNCFLKNWKKIVIKINTKLFLVKWNYRLKANLVEFTGAYLVRWILFFVVLNKWEELKTHIFERLSFLKILRRVGGATNNIFAEVSYLDNFKASARSLKCLFWKKKQIFAKWEELKMNFYKALDF